MMTLSLTEQCAKRKANRKSISSNHTTRAAKRAKYEGLSEAERLSLWRQEQVDDVMRRIKRANTKTERMAEREARRAKRVHSPAYKRQAMMVEGILRKLRARDPLLV